MSFYLGIDFGTSGARAIVICDSGIIQFQDSLSFSASCLNLAQQWREVLYQLLDRIPLHLKRQLAAIAIDGTSATVILGDKFGNPLDEPILYNDDRGKIVLERIKSIAPPNHPVISATSSLAKLYWWSTRSFYPQAHYFLHQADWLSYLLHGQLGVSDYHNALKLGYDVENLRYPDWLPGRDLLPRVLPPGTPVNNISPNLAQRFGINRDCLVCSGTTDSIAAFLAGGATQEGEAVTSLGSTLVLKLLSSTRVESSRYGVYSHRLGDLWLVGGASNTGGAVLRHFFTDEELVQYSAEIDPSLWSGLVYYPLLRAGDRFPVNDPDLQPQLQPRPDNPVRFLHGLLESMARIEAQGYGRLQELGATPLKKVYTAGGGAKNLTWQQIRHSYLKIPVMVSPHTEAAYGVALLAKGDVQSIYSEIK
ncbi:MAG: D-ribulose kinase [Chroococcopsis gigantea SAG 12.99]|jgi:sugar (pentulose or hexulose) kinase|nr:D-ribulose kinase [Chroococcopsis gigantea SAG 12.99]